MPQGSAIGDEEDEQAATECEVHVNGLAVGAPGVEIVYTGLWKAAESFEEGIAVHLVTVAVETNRMSTWYIGLQRCGIYKL